MNARQENKIITKTTTIVLFFALALVAVIGVIVAKSTGEKEPTVAEEKTMINNQPSDFSSAKYALIDTDLGAIIIELFPDSAPKTVTNFVTLARRGYYDQITFHRVVKDFVIQGGDPSGNGSGGESIYGKPFVDELTRPQIEKGTIAMANIGQPDTNTSQFFIVTGDINGSLDGKHTPFGRVIEGMEVVAKINEVEVDSRNDRPINLITIKRITAGDSPDEIKSSLSQANE